MKFSALQVLESISVHDRLDAQYSSGQHWFRKSTDFIEGSLESLHYTIMSPNSADFSQYGGNQRIHINQTVQGVAVFRVKLFRISKLFFIYDYLIFMHTFWNAYLEKVFIHELKRPLH